MNNNKNPHTETQRPGAETRDRKIKIVSLTVLMLVIGTSTLVKAQTTKDILTRFTNDYFEFYNTCQVEAMLALCTDDIEVYHDLVGLIDGKENLNIQSKKFCDWMATKDAPTVKAEIVGDLSIYELKTKDDKLYGAVVNGTINFIAVDKQNGTTTKSGSSDFTWILRLTGNKWQISRDISYNHQDTSDKK